MSESAGDVNKLEFATSTRRLIPMIVGGIGVLLILGGIGFEYIIQQQKGSFEQNQKIGEEKGRDVESSISSISGVEIVKSTQTIKVDVSGSVMKPGVVEIPYDSRI